MQELTISRFAGQWQPTHAVGGSRAFRQQQQRLSVPSVPLVQLSRTEVRLTDQRAERFDKPETGICRWCPEQPKVDIMLIATTSASSGENYARLAKARGIAQH